MELTKAIRAGLRKANASDSDDLFGAAWRRVVAFNRESEVDDLPALYDAIVSELVNNPRSRFYIYG
jgi:hypothetical protein